ncbi:MAG TPA: hypothetical protein VFC84_09415 [Desulfosporosinus sp.]|nr:hypothetical protein [Desulfosporosinus sp.]
MLEYLHLHFLSILEVNFWNYCRATGIVAYLFLWLAIFSGLLSKTKILFSIGLASLFSDVHRKSACISFCFVVFHALILLYDDYIKLNLIDLFIPFQSTYQSINISIGILAFYGIILVIVSMFFLGGKAFAYWHFLTYPLYFLALGHGINIGTDSPAEWMQMIYWSTGSLIIVASIYRIIVSVKGADRSIKT